MKLGAPSLTIGGSTYTGNGCTGDSNLAAGATTTCTVSLSGESMQLANPDSLTATPRVMYGYQSIDSSATGTSISVSTDTSSSRGLCVYITDEFKMPGASGEG